ncbi:MAG: DUF523 domain-containing protein [Aminobacteriaceae bacterium]
MKILVSACLLGIACRYDGSGAQSREILSFMGSCFFIPVCPEIMGGLPTPRDPAEIYGGRVKTIRGIDVTDNYERGALQVLNLSLLYGCRRALLKERSPSCGAGMIYDGSFSGRLVPGEGITAGLLRRNGMKVIGESSVKELHRWILGG